MTRARSNRRNNGKRTVVRELGVLENTLRDISQHTEAALQYPQQSVVDVPRMRVKRDKVHTFVRTSNRVTITASTTVDQSGTYTVSLSDFPSSSDFTNLFDEYRMVQFTFEFFPSSPTMSAPPIYTAVDPDDAAAPTSADSLRQFDTCLIVPSGRFFERTFTPNVSTALYGGGAFTSYGTISPYKTWIDNASPSVLHYGLKYYWPFSATATGSYVVQLSAVIQCRRPA